jgi:hypothetical protein
VRVVELFLDELLVAAVLPAIPAPAPTSAQTVAIPVTRVQPGDFKTIDLLWVSSSGAARLVTRAPVIPVGAQYAGDT